MEASIKNGNRVTIDGKNYPINATETRWFIGKMNHSLVTEIVITATDVTVDTQKGLLDEYKSDGRIKLSLDAIGIFYQGVPTGEFNFEEDKNNDTHKYITKEGLDYRLKFYGTVAYRDSGVFLHGELKPAYGDGPVFLLEAAVTLDPGTLDWSCYRFESLEETVGADPKQVRYLEITNPTFTAFPPEVYDFTNLEYLTVVNKRDYWDQTLLPLASLGDRLGNLVRLKGISINKASINSLPPAIGMLQQLELLNLSLCEISDLPESVWQLPRLAYLILGNNRLTTIPEQIGLPALLTLDVSGNALTTLPESLMQQPKIKTIKATGNPFTALPDRFSFFKGLELSIKEKKKLLDTTYKGADGKGTTKWDNAVYFAESDATLIAPVDDIISQQKLTKYKKPLRSLVKKAVGFNQTTEDDYATVGNHRFGGRPDLPEAIPYPTFIKENRNLHYEFIAQINCEQVADLQQYLPRTGSLFFFFKSFHFFGFDNVDIAKVHYVADNSQLASGKRFAISESDFFELPGGQYTPYRAEAFVVASAPSFYAIHQNSYLIEKKFKTLEENPDLSDTLYDQFEEPVNSITPYDHAINAYGFTQHESPELQAALSLKGDPHDWIILLLVASRGDFQWGDAGDLFFVIHKSDLAKKDFSKVFVTMESS